MHGEKLTRDHKALLYDRLRTMNTAIAEYSFANLYLFRHAHEYEVIIDRELFIRGKSYDGFRYLMPTTDPTTIDIGYLKSMMAGVDFLFPLDEAWMPHFSGSEFESSAKDGDTDYVYTIEKMSTYSGKKLHGKRNLLHQYEGSYRHEEYPLTGERMHDARFILDDWQKESGVAAEETDYAACLEALELYEELVICGGIYYAESEPAGFIIGEELNPETFALHFAKGRSKFKGIYQYLFNNFARILPRTYRYLNFEQDIDKENLRFAKTSYMPDMMVRKLRVRLKS